MKPQRNYPIFKADMVQLSSISTALNKRTGANVTNYDLRHLCRRLDFTPVKVSEKTHESFVPKLQAYGLYDAALAQIVTERSAPDPTPASSPCLLSATDDQIFAELRRRGFTGTIKPAAKTIQL